MLLNRTQLILCPVYNSFKMKGYSMRNGILFNFLILILGITCFMYFNKAYHEASINLYFERIYLLYGLMVLVSFSLGFINKILIDKCNSSRNSLWFLAAFYVVTITVLILCSLGIITYNYKYIDPLFCLVLVVLLGNTIAGIFARK